MEGRDTQPAEGIPDQPTGTPVFGKGAKDVDDGQPVGPTPPYDFWQAIYTRRSIRRFEQKPVPEELVRQVMHAGIWAPSSCNYQMWDLVAVSDPEINGKLTELSSQMGNAPVNIVVSYGREFSEEGWANIQSASAAIQNMSLAAHVLGLGTFWITQMGDREKVREIVGLPEDRLVIAVLALGYPKSIPKRGPKRRSMDHVTHSDYYAGKPIPSSVRPEDWEPDLLATYQRARVLNGLRHNKPRAWEVRAVREALDRLLPDAAEVEGQAEGEQRRWLDVLPCTGIVTDRLAKERKGYAFDVCERTPDVVEFVAERTRPKAGRYSWPHAVDGLELPRAGVYDVVSCMYRVENVSPDGRARLADDIASWVKPGGLVLVAFVNKRSFHDLTEWFRGRRGGPGGVEYVLSPDPNIGPFESLEPSEVESLFTNTGLELVERWGTQAVPAPEEIEFRTRNFSEREREIGKGIGWLLSQIERIPGLARRRGRFQFAAFRRT